MNLKAVIVEDEQHSRESLKNLLSDFCEGIEVAGMAASLEEALSIIPLQKPDVVFLDIELQTGTGFDVLNALPTIDFEVVFTTAFDQYAIKAVKFSSLDYLLKPIDLDELRQAIEKAKKVKNRTLYTQQLQSLLDNVKQPKLSKICLATTDGFEFVEVKDIHYCVAEGSYTSFILTNGNKVMVSKHLKSFESLLTDHPFMRVHNSYLINLQEVNKYVKSDGGYIIMNNGDVVSISRSKKDSFLEAMQSGW